MADERKPEAAQPQRTQQQSAQRQPAQAEAGNPYAQYHIVRKGDTLSKIAEQYYGDMTLYPKIFEANRDVLDDPNRIYPGQRLRIP